MQNSQLEPANVALPAKPSAPLSRRWWQQSVWWPATAILLVLGLANGPSSWVMAARFEGISQTLAWCGLGSMLAQLMLIALVVGCSTEGWPSRVTRAYGVALILCALACGAYYLSALLNYLPNEVAIRSKISYVMLMAVETLVIGVIVAAIMRNNYQARFFHVLGNPPPSQRVRWSLRDMLVWTTLLAGTFAFVRLMPASRISDRPSEFIMASSCTGVLALLGCILSLVAIMECFVHTPPSNAIWKNKFNGVLLILLVGFVALDNSGWLLEHEKELCRMVCALLTYFLCIAMAIFALERFGWRLMVSPKPRTHATRTGAQRSATSA